MTQHTPFSPQGDAQEPRLLSQAVQSTNGTHYAPQTVLEAIQALTTHFNATYWREKLLWCHIPPDAPAEDWDVGIARTAAIYYTAGAGPAA